MQRERIAPQGGFTYVGLLVLVAIIGLVGALTIKAGALMQRAAAEDELLHIGLEFSNALRSYEVATPAGQSRQPRSLQDLLKDPRFPGVRRHLRKIYIDPFTGHQEWGVLYSNEHGVIGVHSLSSARPLKIANFPSHVGLVGKRATLSSWVFFHPSTAPQMQSPL